MYFNVTHIEHFLRWGIKFGNQIVTEWREGGRRYKCVRISGYLNLELRVERRGGGYRLSNNHCTLQRWLRARVSPCLVSGVSGLFYVVFSVMSLIQCSDVPCSVNSVKEDQGIEARWMGTLLEILWVYIASFGKYNVQRFGNEFSFLSCSFLSVFLSILSNCCNIYILE